SGQRNDHGRAVPGTYEERNQCMVHPLRCFITTGPVGQEFPPAAFQPGAVGDKDYSPFVRIVNAGGAIYNASIVAFGVNANDIVSPNGNVDYSKVHDQVVAIDPLNMTVTINLINGFSFG